MIKSINNNIKFIVTQIIYELAKDCNYMIDARSAHKIERRCPSHITGIIRDKVSRYDRLFPGTDSILEFMAIQMYQPSNYNMLQRFI